MTYLDSFTSRDAGLSALQELAQAHAHAHPGRELVSLSVRWRGQTVLLVKLDEALFRAQLKPWHPTQRFADVPARERFCAFVDGALLGYGTRESFAVRRDLGYETYDYSSGSCFQSGELASRGSD